MGAEFLIAFPVLFLAAAANFGIYFVLVCLTGNDP